MPVNYHYDARLHCWNCEWTGTVTVQELVGVIRNNDWDRGSKLVLNDLRHCRFVIANEDLEQLATLVKAAGTVVNKRRAVLVSPGYNTGLSRRWLELMADHGHVAIFTDQDAAVRWLHDSEMPRLAWASVALLPWVYQLLDFLAFT